MTSKYEQRSLSAAKWGSLLMALAGVAAAVTSHSDALMVDGLYSGVNFFAAIIAARVGQQVMSAPDATYPLGQDAAEPIYVTFRALVLLGVMVFAAMSAGGKVITFWSGGDVVALNYGPILIYVVAMVAICFSLSAFHFLNLRRSGGKNAILRTEAQAALFDGLLTAGAGSALLMSQWLVGTFLAPIIPIVDSLIVLLLVVVILPQPIEILRHALKQLMGAAASSDGHQAAVGEVMARHSESFDLLRVDVLPMGRRDSVVVRARPRHGVTGLDVDQLRDEIQMLYQQRFGLARTFVLVTDRSEFSDTDGTPRK